MKVASSTLWFHCQKEATSFGGGLLLNYAAGWTDTGVKELKSQCRGIAKLYEKMILEEKKFYFSPFETKLSTHIRGEEALCNRCLFGKKQVSVDHDGAIYLCVNYLFSHFPIE